jgi:hypothetical protein
MHILYVDHDQYFKYHNPDSKLVPLSVAGIQELRFSKLSEAVDFFEANEDTFIFIEGDDPKVTAYWRWQENYRKWEAECEAERRYKQRSNTNR